MGSAEDLGLQVYAASDVECADTLGPVKLVTGECHSVDGEVGEVAGDFADGLCGIGEEGGVVLAAELADFVDGLDGSGFVVDPVDCD